MTQNELWLTKYYEILDWMNANKRNPSKYHIEEHDYLNWIKYNRKLIKAGKMKEVRMALFEDLLSLSEEYKRINQYE